MGYKRNPKDGEIVRYCANILENLYDSIITNNSEISRHESTMVALQSIIIKLRKLQNYIR